MAEEERQRLYAGMFTDALLMVFASHEVGGPIAPAVYGQFVEELLDVALANPADAARALGGDAVVAWCGAAQVTIELLAELGTVTGRAPADIVRDVLSKIDGN